MNFTTIIYGDGKKESIIKTKDSSLEKLGGNVISVNEGKLYQYDQSSMSEYPVEQVLPNTLSLGDVIIYAKMGVIFHDEFKGRVIETLNELDQIEICGVYCDYLQPSRLDQHIVLNGYDRTNWINTSMIMPVMALRKKQSISLTVTPSIDYFQYLNQSVPIVKIPEHLVTLDE